MRIHPIEYLDMPTIHKILVSNKISDAEKISFVRRNSSKIKDIVDEHITSNEYKMMMKNRPLEKFKPIKNSYTKRGDKIILAGALGIPVSLVNEYIQSASDKIASGGRPIKPTEEMDKIKTYVYRHGTKDQVINFLAYELGTAKNKLNCLYRTLEYNAGGVADYFVRPIHRMNNKTLVYLYKTIDDHLSECRDLGLVSQSEKDRNAEWALVRICKIQSNSKLINAVKTYRKLKAAY